MIEIRFTPTNSNSELTLTIGEAAQGATATRVEGTRDVFVTNEEDDSDVFMPVRTTSGTVRFYNKDNAWSQLANISNTHQPVTLSQGNSVLWQGYINKGYVGTRRLFGYNEECEIAVQCPLMELDTVDYEPKYTVTPMMTLGAIVTDILTDPFGTGTSPYVIMNIEILDSEYHILNYCYVYMGTFYKTEKEPDGTATYTPRYTRKGALEEVLKMACCTAHWTGTAVEIKAMKEVTSGTGISPLTFTPADTDCSETAVMPFKKVEVTADADGNDTAIEFPTAVISNWAKLREGSAGEVTVSRGLTDVHPVVRSYSQIGTITGDVDDQEYEYECTIQGGTSTPYIVAYQDRKNIGSDTAQNLSPALWLNYPDPIGETDIDNNTSFTCTEYHIRTKQPFFVYDAILVVQIRLKGNFVDGEIDGIIKIRVKVGNMCFDPTSNSWVEVGVGHLTPDMIEATFENGELKRTGNLNYNFETYSGFGIPVDGTLNGIVDIEITMPDDYHNVGITIDSLSVKAVRHVSDIHEKSSFTVKDPLGSGEDSVELAYCSGRRADNADNFLFLRLLSSNEYVVAKELSLDDTEQLPEQWVAARHASMNTGKARSLLSIRSKESIAPGRYTYANKIYETLAINHDWAEGVTEAHLIEIS